MGTKKVQRQAVVDDLGRVLGLLPRGYRGSKGNFEYGPRDRDGIRHIQGIARIKTIRVFERDLPAYSDFDPALIA